MKRSSRGQAAVEFALVVPIIVVIILGLQWVGPRITQEIQLTNAARAGARAAADAADQIETALSCTAPATFDCIRASADLVQNMVDSGLPCPRPPVSTDPTSDQICEDAVHAFAMQAATYGLTHCTPSAGCSLPAEETSAVLTASSCKGVATCVSDAEAIGRGAVEAGLGCDTPDPPRSAPVPNPQNCPKPLDTSGPPTCTVPPAVPAGASPRCIKETSEEIIAGVAQKALACLAIRKALDLPLDKTICNHDDSFGAEQIPAGDNTDDPVFEEVQSGSEKGLLTFQCINNVRATLFHDICNTPVPHNKMVLELVTVHWHGLTATATAAPDSQFTAQ